MGWTLQQDEPWEGEEKGSEHLKGEKVEQKDQGKEQARQMGEGSVRSRGRYTRRKSAQIRQQGSEIAEERKNVNEMTTRRLQPPDKHVFILPKG